MKQAVALAAVVAVATCADATRVPPSMDSAGAALAALIPVLRSQIGSESTLSNNIDSWCSSVNTQVQSQVEGVGRSVSEARALVQSSLDGSASLASEKKLLQANSKALNEQWSLVQQAVEMREEDEGVDTTALDDLLAATRRATSLAPAGPTSESLMAVEQSSQQSLTTDTAEHVSLAAKISKVKASVNAAQEHLTTVQTGIDSHLAEREQQRANLAVQLGDLEQMLTVAQLAAKGASASCQKVQEKQQFGSLLDQEVSAASSALQTVAPESAEMLLTGSLSFVQQQRRHLRVHKRVQPASVSLSQAETIMSKRVEAKMAADRAKLSEQAADLKQGLQQFALLATTEQHMDTEFSAKLSRASAQLIELSRTLTPLSTDDNTQNRQGAGEAAVGVLLGLLERHQELLQGRQTAWQAAGEQLRGAWGEAQHVVEAGADRLSRRQEAAQVDDELQAAVDA